MRPYLLWVTVLLAVGASLSLYRVFRGPTAFDRLTGLGLIATKTIVLVLLMGSLTGRMDVFVDIALGYGLVGLLGSLALARYFESRRRTGP
jgi:multicomponent Na+:H+ antiporter subunit F